mmetsp:Transcript_28577/g.60949  ORF Transcript_28577/g.60949 Transcript_28577/m.60949 type:complete len:733 (-) Transcript_28577:100-2298(-)|eukprot:CAMPEP_0172317174 /NCGR_PEP_ID=MMETSP1058-20130122/30769_1 /TAXON_ID=83371 /ORGANISM="Detonula confervacea, Strain CCMP 353" /LENGTH=732 /DNA_ID=CAMNT_0013031673 /DNA_START=438 /DNA_END=2636 /DNA_ORIENTATION=-
MSNSSSSETDKFQVFERWLRVNGAQFPLLELRKYDSPNTKNEQDADLLRDNLSTTETDNNEAEEKKDGGNISSESEGVAMMSLDNGHHSSHLEEEKDGDDGSKEMRGVHARTTIPPQTTCVSIPKSCLITVEMGQATPIGRKILSSNLELDAPKHIFLMIYLLWDKKLHGVKSFFAPYYNILPESLRNMPIFWNEEELRYLKGSHLLVQISDRAEAIRDDYESICGIAPELFTIATLEEFQWARMIVCSRNFGLLINGHRTSALVPHADMLNHYRPRETKWTFCEDTQCFTITSLQTIGRGAQVYDSYGQKCNHRFLLNYGFCVERNVEVDGFCPNEVPLELGLDLAGLTTNHDDRQQCFEKKLAFWLRGDVAAGSHHLFSSEQVVGAMSNNSGNLGASFHALAAAVAGASSTARGMTTTTLSSSTDIVRNMASINDDVTRGSAGGTSTPALRRRCPIKRVRVCVSNNENTRILFSMLRVLACNSSELDRIASLGGRLGGSSGGGGTASSFYSGGTSSTAQRLFGIPSSSSAVVGAATTSSSNNMSMRTCRDIRYPINLRNERRAMELLLESTARALSKYPTSLAQDTADLRDEDVHPKYSNRRNAKLQVRGEKEVLHHFALWARTAMHVIDIILHELEVERKLLVTTATSTSLVGGGDHHRHVVGKSLNVSAAAAVVNQNEELGYDYVIQAMEEDDDCHSTILRYCSDVLGAVRRDELNRMAANAVVGSIA